MSESYAAAGIAALQAMEPGTPAPLPGSPAPPGDPLASVGIALLAYALVQLLARVIDRLPIGKNGGGDGGNGRPPAPGFGGDERTRLERMHELARIDHERITRMEEALREVHEHTRWLNEQRLSGRGGPFQCRAPVLGEEMVINRRLIGQALDTLREVQGQNTTLLRRLRSLWTRVARRRDDG